VEEFFSLREAKLVEELTRALAKAVFEETSEITVGKVLLFHDLFTGLEVRFNGSVFFEVLDHLFPDGLQKFLVEDGLGSFLLIQNGFENLDHTVSHFLLRVLGGLSKGGDRVGKKRTSPLLIELGKKNLL
jgi:hypothetical protein